jgi:hypothetical protein
LDLTQDKHAEVFTNSFKQWVKQLLEDKDGSKYGWPDVIGTELQPYGTNYDAALQHQL